MGLMGNSISLTSELNLNSIGLAVELVGLPENSISLASELNQSRGRTHWYRGELDLVSCLNAIGLAAELIGSAGT